MKFVFLGGVFPDAQYDYIEENSSGVMQNAADALQKKLIDGLDSVTKDGILVINLPFVGSFPKFFKKIYLPGVKGKIGKNSDIFGVGFLNLFIIRIFSRFVSSLIAIFRFCKKGDCVLFVYSAHLPFVLASVLLRLINSSAKICLIVPDLPQYMGDSGFIYRIFKNIDSAIFILLIKRINYFVVLTKYMAEKMHIEPGRFVVIEGVASKISMDTSICHEKMHSIKSFLYSGTLARRYGILDLVDAFSKIKDDNAELWICGEGDGRGYITTAVARDNRIKFFGQLKRVDVLELQSKASVLINPRPPGGEFTKYSFPSKIMEYMASGRPIIMYKLDGIPDEYDSYYMAPKGVGVESLSDCMKKALEMEDQKLSQIGFNAMEFILREKNPSAQAKKILNLVTKGC